MDISQVSPVSQKQHVPLKNKDFLCQVHFIPLFPVMGHSDSLKTIPSFPVTGKPPQILRLTAFLPTIPIYPKPTLSKAHDIWPRKLSQSFQFDVIS